MKLKLKKDTTQLPVATYGADRSQPNWREIGSPDVDDDAELETTPADTVALLGFDPKDL